MNNKAMADKLKQLRREKNKSKEEVANDLDITVRSIEAYESGRRVPRDSVKVQLATYYGKSVEYIFFKNNQHEL